MIWDKIETQPFAVGILKAHVETGRLAATYVFSGDVQAGKEEMAQALACALNCGRKKSFEPCECASCAKILNGNHPDVRWLGKAEERARSIKIEEVRDMLNWVYLKPYEGEWKVFIVTEADRLTLEAANALLKTLEEPPTRTIFCLLVENRSNLLETIQSRSFELKLRALSDKIEPDFAVIKAEIAGLGERNWEDLLEDWQSLKRDKLNQAFVRLMFYFRELIRAQLAGGKQDQMLQSYLDAIDRIYEASEALQANANQKLVLSRLAMQLRTAMYQRV